MSKTISARIDDTLHTMITDEANQTGMTVNEKLKGMINDHFSEENNEIYSRKLDEILTEQNESDRRTIRTKNTKTI